MVARIMWALGVFHDPAHKSWTYMGGNGVKWFGKEVYIDKRKIDVSK